MNNKNFAFKRINFILLAVGMAIVIIGFVIMSGQGSTETRFNPAIFDARHIKVAPVVCLFGYLFMIFAVAFTPKQSGKTEHTDSAETKKEGK